MKKKIQALCASLFMGILLFMAGVQTFAEPSYTSKFSDWGNLLKQYANDENGNEVKFEFLDLMEYEGEEYIILLPTEESEDNDEVVILKVEDVEDDPDMETYVSVDDEDTLNAVFEMFKEKFKDFQEIYSVVASFYNKNKNINKILFSFRRWKGDI